MLFTHRRPLETNENNWGRSTKIRKYGYIDKSIPSKLHPSSCCLRQTTIIPGISQSYMYIASETYALKFVLVCVCGGGGGAKSTY